MNKPRSSSMMRVTVVETCGRVMITALPLNIAQQSSSQAIAARSRWLVGSSAATRSGDATSAQAMATRFFNPPEAWRRGWLGDPAKLR